MRACCYTDRHPDEVVGMVLVDPSFPDQFALRQQVAHAPTGEMPESPIVANLRKCATDIRTGTAKASGPDPDHCFDYPPSWPPALRHALAMKVSNPVQYEAMASFAGSSTVDSKLVINPARNYRDMPLIVLTALSPLPPGVQLSDTQKANIAAMDAQWNRAHDELAALSSRGVNARVPGASHAIQHTKPQVVLDALAEVVREARELRP